MNKQWMKRRTTINTKIWGPPRTVGASPGQQRAQEECRDECPCFFRDFALANAKPEKSAGTQRKKECKKRNYEPERKKARIHAFSSLPHRKPGYRAQSCSVEGKTRVLSATHSILKISTVSPFIHYFITRDRGKK